jgi:uncharacterized membrane protein YbaN (DUF454 family)
MDQQLIRPAGAGNPACPSERIKRVLGASGVDGEAAALTPLRRALYFTVGWVSLGTGVLGMFLPVLPTTCFLLLAAWCFGKSSPRWARWMYENRLFGKYLKDYREGRGIPLGVKIGSLSILWASIMGTVLFAVSATWLRLLLLGIAVAVTVHLVTLRNTPRPAAS